MSEVARTRASRAVVAALGILACAQQARPADGVEPVDAESNSRLRRAASSQELMAVASVLTDHFGPRLTGSPAHENAARWVADKFRKWGLANARLEPWDFGHPGWSNESAYGYLVKPVRAPLVIHVQPWSPGTHGRVTADAVEIEPPPNPSRQELEDWLKTGLGQVRGKFVLTGKSAAIAVPPAKPPGPPVRWSMEELLQQLNPSPGRTPETNVAKPGAMAAADAAALIDRALVSAGALMRIYDSAMDGNVLPAVAPGTRAAYDQPLPVVILRNSDYGRIERLMQGGTPVQLEFEVVNRLYPEGRTSYNVLADIPGSERPGETVIAGEHLDSWTGGTGATDDAIGCAIVMEAARILRQLPSRPKRTITIALWSGEEQGILGSAAWVAAHLATPEARRNTIVHVNTDMGGGRARTAQVGGPPEAVNIVRAVLMPFADLGFAGARRSGASNDNRSFDEVGVPSVRFGADILEGLATWHNTRDTYDRLVPDDAVQRAILTAGLLWHIANRPEALPRESGR